MAFAKLGSLGKGFGKEGSTAIGPSSDPFIKNVITARTGRFNLTGETMDGLVYSMLGAASGSFAIASQAINMFRGRSVVADPGAFILTGIDAGLVRTQPGAYVLASALGSFSLTGIAANLVKATPPSYTGPGDVQTTNWRTWAGLRAFNGAYAAALSPIADLVDQAGGNQITINSTANGDLNTAAIASWVTANSVTTIKVKRLYDQTGNTLHFEQATLANMPRLVANSQGTKYGVVCTQANIEYLATANPVTTTAIPWSQSIVARDNIGGFRAIMLDASFRGLFSGSSSTDWVLYNSTDQAFPAGTGAPHAVMAVQNGASSSAYTDGTLTSGLNPGSGSLAGRLGIGASATGGFESNTIFFEGGFNAADLTSVQASMVTNQRTYWGF